MSGRTLSLVGIGRKHFEFYSRALHSICSDIRLVGQKIDFKELQDLDEEAVIKDKAFQAARLYNPPFVVESEGFYIDGFECFPGTVSDSAVKGLGWKEICLSMADKKNVKLFCQLGFMDSSEQLYIFRESIDGSFVCSEKHIAKGGTVEDFFVPKGQKMTLTQVESVPEFQGLFPRYRAIEAMARSKVFGVEFSRTRHSLSAGKRF